jgi:WD40 repeat protein
MVGGRRETRILPPGTPLGVRGNAGPAGAAKTGVKIRSSPAGGSQANAYDLLETQARPVVMSYSDAEPQLAGVPAGQARQSPKTVSKLSAVPKQDGVSNTAPGISGPATRGMKDVLQKVVIPQINECLKRAGDGLDEVTKKKIGRQTATKVCGLELQTHLAANNGWLSEAMRKTLIEKCALLVGIYVHKAGDNQSKPQTPQAPPVAKRQIARRQRPTKQSIRPEPIVISGSSSESDKEDVYVDALEQLGAGETAGQKRCSSSPSTSYTVESPPKESMVESDPQNTKGRPHRQVKLDLAPRSPAAGTRPIRKQTGGKGGRVQKQTHARAGRSGTRIAAANRSLLREVEILRLAANAVPRPYLSLSARKDIARGLSVGERGLTPPERNMLRDSIVHVDFTSEEVQYVRNVMDVWYREHVESKPQMQRLGIISGSIKIYPSLLQMIVKSQQESSGFDEGARLINQRSEESIKNFLDDYGMDIWKGYLSNGAKFAISPPAVLRVAPKSRELGTTGNNHASVSSILRDRELSRRSFGRAHTSTKARILTSMDDAIMREIEFTGCSGDIATITWLPGDKFVCGAITHSDENNQQYNKPGNLALGSAESLRSVSGHRIIRPIVEKGSNALESMRETQDPYLYCSVAATAFHEGSQKALTGSFDKTVKVWEVSSDGSGMSLCGTWHHGGVINFVVTSPHHDKIATGADVFSDAIRVYEMDQDDVSNSPFVSYSGSRADEQSAQQLRSRQSWVYYPSTLQWGKAPSVAHLLLAGYSPRSFNVHEEVPKIVEDTGELCLWDTTNGTRVLITSARTQNVFEVAWHPTLPVFVAATSATGEHEDGVRTQLRIFSQTELGTFSQNKIFDCRAVDINEITLMPNSPGHCYLTASCTDGCTYVWDSAQEDKPIHVLEHGKSIDDQSQDDGETKEDDHEKVDSGVKFSAWGRTPDRFFTGSSDGVVKAWNVRAPPGEEHVADVITLSGGISAGIFSSDHSRLLIGDATGKLNVLKCGDLDECEETPPRRRQQPIIPHYEPQRSTGNGDGDVAMLSPEPTAREMAQKYIDAGQIVIHPDPYVGAVQGENYMETGLFCRSLHQGDDPRSEPLPDVVRQQQMRSQRKRLVLRTTRDIAPCPEPHHRNNYLLDLQPMELDHQTAADLETAGVDFAFADEHDYVYEPDLAVAEGGDEDEDVVVATGDDSSCGGEDVYLSKSLSYFATVLPAFACFV